MNFFEASLLGVIQGITEFLPISSDGHLVIAQGYLRAFQQNPMTFDVVLHFGTLLAVLYYFRRDVRALVFFLGRREVQGNLFPARRWVWSIFLATLPTGVIGLALEKSVEPLFVSPVFAAGGLLVNGTLLLSTGLAPSGQRSANDIKVRDALLIGLMQGFAVLPGISRSSNTIATAMFLGIRGEVAARFSFLLSIPAVMGAVLIKVSDLDVSRATDLIPYGVGVAFALMSGIWAISFLLKVIVMGRFRYFGYYCFLLGGGVMGLHLLGRG